MQGMVGVSEAVAAGRPSKSPAGGPPTQRRRGAGLNDARPGGLPLRPTIRDSAGLGMPRVLRPALAPSRAGRRPALRAIRAPAGGGSGVAERTLR